ncbi:MAG: late competence development ComFB family protein [Pseudanabaenaceae cyanobacterium]
MESCRNVFWDVVVAEVERRSGLSVRVPSEQPKLSYLTAFALNQLPALYVTTDVEWAAQRQHVELMFGKEITDAVRFALRSVAIDGSRPAVVPAVELDIPARALLRLQLRLQHSGLTWRDVPVAVATLLEVELSRFQGQDKPLVLEVGGDTPELHTYMLPARLNCFHALRLLVTRLALQKIQALPCEIGRYIRLEDVVARSLNRLPSLYATDETSLEELRRRAKFEIGSQLALAVDVALKETRKAFFQQQPPLLFHRLKEERKEAMQYLRQLLQNPQINWRNFNDAVEAAVFHAKQGRITWQR